MDGFDAINTGTQGLGRLAGLYPYGFVKRTEVKPYWDMASQYTLADHMFSTEKSDSYPAHEQVIAGTTASERPRIASRFAVGTTLGLRCTDVHHDTGAF